MARFLFVLVGVCFFGSGLALAKDVEIPKIVVTASQIEEDADKAVQTVEVVSASEIRRRQAKTVAEALRSVAGLDVSSLGAPAEDLDVRIRGSDRDEVLVLLDGVPINNIIESRNLLLQSIPTEFIERIEIVRGAASVLYGGSAGGGVVNVITKDAGKTAVRSVSAHAGNLGTFVENATVIDSYGKHNLGTSFTRHDQAGRFDNDRYGSNAYFLNYSFAPSSKFRVKSHVMILNQKQELAFGNAISFASFPTINYYITRDLDRDLRRDIVVPQLIVTAKPFEFYEAEFSYAMYWEDQTLKNSNAGETPPEAAATVDSQLFDSTGHRHRFDLKNRFELMNHGNFKSHLILGAAADLEFLSYTDAAFPGDVSAKTTTTFPDESIGQEGDRRNFAGYALSLSELGPRVTASLGLRYDDNSTYGTAASPRFSIGYRHLETDTRLYASYAQGFFAPTINQYYLAVAGGTLTQRLDKEVSQTYETGISQRLFGDMVRAKAAFFYTDYDTVINESQLIADAHVVGLETGLNVKPLSWLKIGANYTFMKSKNDTNGTTLASRPDHHLNGEVFVTPLKALDFWFNARYVSSQVIPTIISTQAFGDLTTALFDQNGNRAGERLPSYFTLNMAARYTQKIRKPWLKEIVFSARAHNLLNKSYQERFGYPMPKFNFLGGAEFRF